MARLRDVPHVLRHVGLWTFVKRVYQQITEDEIFIYAASLAYSYILALFPFLIFTLSLAPYLPYGAKDAVMENVARAVAELPEQAQSTILENINNLLQQQRGGLLSIGIAVTLWIASGGVSATMVALDKCYDVKKVRNFIWQRIVAIGLTVAITGSIILVAVLLPLGTLAIKWLTVQGLLGGLGLVALQLTRWTLAVLLMLAIISILYYFGPSLRSRFHAITPGAVFTLVLWLAMGYGLRLYIDNFADYNQTYGTLGGVAILLFMFYLGAIVFLVGAEINSEIDFAVLGIPSGTTPEAQATAPLPEDPEARELARELEQKRQT